MFKLQDVVVGFKHYARYLPFSDPHTTPVPQRIIRKIPGNGAHSFRPDVGQIVEAQCNQLQVPSLMPL